MDSGRVGGRLSGEYEETYAELLAIVGTAARITPRELSLFWPKVGRRFDGGTLLIGRAVNGWIDRWDLDTAEDPEVLARVARQTAEGGVNGCPMGWVLDRWKPGDGEYDTSRSQFWVTARAVAVAVDPGSDPDWPSHLAWSNLAKISKWASGNPPWRLRQSQLALAIRLLGLEVKELAPQRVLVLAGRDWFEPYARALGLEVSWREGLVEGVADDGQGRRWVVAVHPMTRSPAAVAGAVVAAFGDAAP
ncbi:MAG: hypothetical protein U0R64_11550 [Candidatus Nanopelagicales bacterium]